MKTKFGASRAVSVGLTIAIALSLTFARTANATLIDRGGGLVYDTELNLTWLQNTNIAGPFLEWQNAMAWAEALVYQGYGDWRLPDSPGTQQGFINEGEMGHLYYTTLGNPAGGPRTNSGPFVNFPSNNIFWLSATPLHDGSAWAVREGDSVPLPEPATWLHSTTLAIGLLAYHRRNRRWHQFSAN